MGIYDAGDGVKIICFVVLFSAGRGLVASKKLRHRFSLSTVKAIGLGHGPRQHGQRCERRLQARRFHC